MKGLIALIAGICLRTGRVPIYLPTAPFQLKSGIPNRSERLSSFLSIRLSMTCQSTVHFTLNKRLFNSCPEISPSFFSSKIFLSSSLFLFRSYLAIRRHSTVRLSNAHVFLINHSDSHSRMASSSCAWELSPFFSRRAIKRFFIVSAVFPASCNSEVFMELVC